MKKRDASPTNFAYDRRETALFTSAIHTAINICLFPPLFFFLGLYYTDVPSTLFVLLSYHHALRTQQKKDSKISSAIVTVLIGIAALFFRQTNIFWVAVFPAGLAVVQALKKSAHPPPEGAKEETVLDVLRISAMNMSVYDKPVRFASVTGLLDHVPLVDGVLIQNRLRQNDAFNWNRFSTLSNHGSICSSAVRHSCWSFRRVCRVEWRRSFGYALDPSTP